MPNISLLWLAPPPQPKLESVAYNQGSVLSKNVKRWMTQGERMILNSFMVENTFKTQVLSAWPKVCVAEGSVSPKGTPRSVAGPGSASCTRVERLLCAHF